MILRRATELQTHPVTTWKTPFGAKQARLSNEPFYLYTVMVSGDRRWPSLVDLSRRQD